MNTVTFKKSDGTTKNSYADLGLLLRPKKIAPPEPKVIRMAIDGRDGDLDLTEWAGEVRYNDRAFPLSFYMTCALSEIEEKATAIKNWLHGQRVQITFADDALYYYDARISVSDAHADGGLGVLDMSVVAAPYKLAQEKTYEMYDISGTKKITLNNDRMTARPKVITDGAYTIVQGGATYNVAQAGEYEWTTLLLREGYNDLTITGTGRIAFEWQKGAL